MATRFKGRARSAQRGGRKTRTRGTARVRLRGAAPSVLREESVGSLIVKRTRAANTNRRTAPPVPLQSPTSQAFVEANLPAPALPIPVDFHV